MVGFRLNGASARSQHSRHKRAWDKARHQTHQGISDKARRSEPPESFVVHHVGYKRNTVCCSTRTNKITTLVETLPPASNFRLEHITLYDETLWYDDMMRPLPSFPCPFRSMHESVQDHPKMMKSDYLWAWETHRNWACFRSFAPQDSTWMKVPVPVHPKVPVHPAKQTATAMHAQTTARYAQATARHGHKRALYRPVELCCKISSTERHVQPGTRHSRTHRGHIYIYIYMYRYIHRTHVLCT